jgi:hypothetical protein
MDLKLSDEETAALAALLRRMIAADRCPLSPRIRVLQAILDRIEPPPVREPSPSSYPIRGWRAAALRAAARGSPTSRVRCTGGRPNTADLRFSASQREMIAHQKSGGWLLDWRKAAKNRVFGKPGFAQAAHTGRAGIDKNLAHRGAPTAAHATLAFRFRRCGVCWRQARRRPRFGRQRRQDAEQTLAECHRGGILCHRSIFWWHTRISNCGGNDVPGARVNRLEQRVVADLSAAPSDLVCDRLLRLALAGQAPDRLGQIDKRRWRRGRCDTGKLGWAPS